MKKVQIEIKVELEFDVSDYYDEDKIRNGMSYIVPYAGNTAEVMSEEIIKLTVTPIPEVPQKENRAGIVPYRSPAELMAELQTKRYVLQREYFESEDAIDKKFLTPFTTNRMEKFLDNVYTGSAKDIALQRIYTELATLSADIATVSLQKNSISQYCNTCGHTVGIPIVPVCDCPVCGEQLLACDLCLKGNCNKCTQRLGLGFRLTGADILKDVGEL